MDPISFCALCPTMQFFFPRRWPPPITSSSLFQCACHTVITVCTFKYVQSPHLEVVLVVA